ncbi:MAG: ribbon-helix-helix protein, CopG family [Deltaproteobacteria bacterium]|nr:ribbon-helix-helix protein, CopG family [Deltaproteobacteria bacterium]
MPLSVRLDAKTESLIGRLARKRQQSKSEVIRDAIGVLAKQEEKGTEKKRPYDLVAHLIGCVKGGPPDLSVNTGEKFHQLLLERRRKRQ